MNVKTVLRLLSGAVLAAAVVVAFLNRNQLDGAALEHWVASAGAAGPLLFMLIYALATVLFLPGSVITLAGGALFGPVWGTLYNLTGATLGAALAFLAARYFAHGRAYAVGGQDARSRATHGRAAGEQGWVERRTGSRLHQLVTGVEQQGWRFVAFVRLVPLFPFNLLNYALGMTRIRFVSYVVTSYITMLPGALAYTYLGYAGREAVAGGQGLVQKGMLALALVALVAFLPSLLRRLRAPANTMAVPELDNALADGSIAGVLDVRDTAEYAGGHISGAFHIPVAELPARIDELGEWRERPLAVICRSDRRSAKAVKLLESAGFLQPILVREGMLRWERDALPVESTREATPEMDSLTPSWRGRQ